jgi:hypothetical protein
MPTHDADIVPTLASLAIATAALANILAAKATSIYSATLSTAPYPTLLLGR